jgi:hypothetical protein
VWNAKDIDVTGSVVANVFEPEHPKLAVPPLYPFPLDPRLWMFDSVWFYAEPTRLARAINDTALDTLEAQRGLFIAHTYLSASTRTTLTQSLKNKDAVVEDKGVMRIEPHLDAALGRLGARVARGEIASLTWRQAGERLRALGDVSIEYGKDGATVVNHGSVDLPKLTVEVGGRPETFDLAGGGSHALAGAGRAVPATIEVRSP